MFTQEGVVHSEWRRSHRKCLWEVFTRKSKTGQMATSGEEARHRLHRQDAGQGVVGCRHHLCSGEYFIVIIIFMFFFS